MDLFKTEGRKNKEARTEKAYKEKYHSKFN